MNHKTKRHPYITAVIAPDFFSWNYYFHFLEDGKEKRIQTNYSAFRKEIHDRGLIITERELKNDVLTLTYS